MPKQSQQVEMNSFVGGLNTEANALSFPPNSAADIINFDLFRDGTIRRRLGMNFETSYSLVDTGLSSFELANVGYNAFRWLEAAGDSTANFIVFQIGSKLFVFDETNAPLSGNLKSTLDFSAFGTNTQFSMTSVEGFMVVAAGQETVGVVTYSNGAFSTSFQRLLTRDLWGIEEKTDPGYEADPTYRGTVDAQDHRYNLYNQSWGIPRKNATGTLINPVTNFHKDLGKYPSNSEEVWVGLQMQAVANSSVSSQQPFERQFTNLYDDSLGAKVSGAKGAFIIDALRRGQGRQTAITANIAKYPLMTMGYAFPTDFTPGGAKAVAEFAGRVFFAGFNGQVVGGDARSPNYSNYVFFSQLVKKQADIFKCYQDGDPTSRDSSDVVDTDGGFVKVSGIQNIVSMHNLGINLVIIAQNGVWAITGGTTDSGFSATNYKVNKISAFGGLSATSVVVEGDTAYYWSEDGIYQIGKNQFGDLQVTNTTLEKIQKMYQAIPNDAKINCYGAYDPVNKKIRWIYKAGTLFQEDSITQELVLDTNLGAFYSNQVMAMSDYSIELVGIFQTPLLLSIVQDEQVMVRLDPVQAGSDLVLSDVLRYVPQTQYLRYFALRIINDQAYLTVSYFYDTGFVDWRAADGVGVDAMAYCLTGSITGGDTVKAKQTPYLFVHMVKTDDTVDANGVPTTPSSCWMRSQWNFASGVYSNKWSPLVQAYREAKLRMDGTTANPYDTNYTLITSKNKLRGRGRAVALYYQTEAAKDCHIIGWSLSINVNQIA